MVQTKIQGTDIDRGTTLEINKVVVLGKTLHLDPTLAKTISWNPSKGCFEINADIELNSGLIIKTESGKRVRIRADDDEYIVTEDADEV